MTRTRFAPLGLGAGLILVLVAGAALSEDRGNPQPSAILSQETADRQEFDWGTLYTYYAGESYGTTDGLAAVAVIRPGQEIHPPHEHAEEEYLMVIEGAGSWHLEGEDRPAGAGDMLYAAPWDLHGIKNTGTEPLTFVVWKWNSKGVPLAPQPR